MAKIRKEHRDTAEMVLGALICVDGRVNGDEDFVQTIAQALAEAEAEGERRANEKCQAMFPFRRDEGEGLVEEAK